MYHSIHAFAGYSSYLLSNIRIVLDAHMRCLGMLPHLSLRRLLAQQASFTGDIGDAHGVVCEISKDQIQKIHVSHVVPTYRIP